MGTLDQSHSQPALPAVTKPVGLAAADHAVAMESIFRTATVGIGIVRDRLLVEVNPGFCNMTGYLPDELIGQSTRFLYVSEAEYERIGRENYSVMKAVGVGVSETRLRCKDGQLVDVLLSLTPVIPADPTAGVSFMLVDITRRRQNERELNLRNVQMAAVFDRVPNVTCLFDERLRIVRANRAAAEFARREPVELLSLSARDFFRCPCTGSPDQPGCTGDPNSGYDLHHAVTETLLTGKSWQRVRVRQQLQRGEHLDELIMLVSTDRIQVDGMTCVLFSLEDVTQNELADEQIRSQAALLDISRDAILVRDFSDRILYWNEGAHRLYGWTAAEALGHTMNELILSRDPLPTIEALRTVRDKEDWAGEMKHRTRDGREIVVQSRWNLVRARDGSPKAILVVSTDVTETKKLEAQLLRAQRLESIGTLASGLAHDLNNVLAPVMMAAHVLREESRTDTAKMWIETIETCAQRGADIVRQVLTFARGVEGARVPLQPKRLTQEMQRIARETFPRSIAVQARYCKSPWLILGDATQIQQVLMNLCVNARDAMPNGGTLTLTVEQVRFDSQSRLIHHHAKPGPYIILSVKDTGTGIPHELVDKIFDPFFTTKPLGQGTGLGLPTVLGIAESHGGFVQVESEVGQGTEFRIYLPATPSAAESIGNETETIQFPKGNGELILVVDDEPAIRKMTQVILAMNGYRTLEATDGNEAISVFTQNPGEIKLVITDLMMPNLDGPGAIRAMRQIRPEIKTIIITGLGEENRVATAKAAGADGLLNKPFTSEQLLMQVSQLLKPASVVIP